MSSIYDRVANLEFDLKRIKAEISALIWAGKREEEEEQKEQKEKREKDRNNAILKARIITALNPYLLTWEVPIIANLVVDSILAPHADVKITFNCT